MALFFVFLGFFHVFDIFCIYIYIKYRILKFEKNNMREIGLGLIPQGNEENQG